MSYPLRQSLLPSRHPPIRSKQKSVSPTARTRTRLQSKNTASGCTTTGAGFAGAVVATPPLLLTLALRWLWPAVEARPPEMALAAGPPGEPAAPPEESPSLRFRQAMILRWGGGVSRCSANSCNDTSQEDRQRKEGLENDSALEGKEERETRCILHQLAGQIDNESKLMNRKAKRARNRKAKRASNRE
jgi:hypothetical protein